jgi:sugar/nucleoside kinase (ribokinase family)
MRIAGAGCSLVDYLYSRVSYSSETFQRYLSRTAADGGIIPGGLVFTEDLEKFASKPFAAILSELLGETQPDSINLGGPAAVSMIGAAQILSGTDTEFDFYAASGTDEAAQFIADVFGRTSVRATLSQEPGLPTPSTVVLSDPDAADGKGERSFLNTIGAAAAFSMASLPDSFYDADIVLLGGTALVPALHDELSAVLARAKENGAFTVVGTVYDFRNERRAPNAVWPLGDEQAYSCIDLLVSDAQEAFRLTGEETIPKAMEWFAGCGVKSAVITHGSQKLLAYSNGKAFSDIAPAWYPVSRWIDVYMRENPHSRCDTTGCGDNFLGGITAAVAMQLEDGRCMGKLDMNDCIAWACAAGGFACLHYGGVYHEARSGEKRERLLPIVEDYERQAGRL